MSKEAEEESFAPSSHVHFASDGSFIWVSAKDIEGDASEDGKVLGGIVFTRSGLIFVEADVELPMEVIFDAPMGTGDFKQPFWGQQRGQGDIAGGGFDLVATAALGLDASDRRQPGKGRGISGRLITVAHRHSWRS